MAELKIIKTSDVIYDDYIELTPLAKSIIDTPIFQPMRFIKQLSFAYLLYMNANHTRFEHLLGTYYITKKWILHLRKLYPNCITDEIMEWICIGALCHDLGHSSFSHSFDKVTGTQHEIRSIMAFKYLVRKYDIKISEEGVKIVEHVIDGKFLEGYPPWFFELVCNKKNNVDSDKFDYLRRDMFYCNMGRKPPINRIIRFSRINAEGHICFLKSAEIDIETMFMDRYLMFMQVYLHPVLVSLEEGILVPMLQRISKLMNWNNLLADPHCAWRELDDTLIHIIPKSEQNLLLKPKSEIADWCFVKNCWDRIMNRNLPSWIFVDSEMCEFKNELERVVPIKLNFTLGESNPLKHIYWSDSTLDTSSYDMHRQSSEEVKSRIHPDKYEVIRYLKINLKIPLTTHYKTKDIINFVKTSTQLPKDACIHSVHTYLDQLIPLSILISDYKILYNWELQTPLKNTIILLVKDVSSINKQIWDFCNSWDILITNNLDF
jgi:HD superfamily phosphohydrolase